MASLELGGRHHWLALFFAKYHTNYIPCKDNDVEDILVMGGYIGTICSLPLMNLPTNLLKIVLENVLLYAYLVAFLLLIKINKSNQIRLHKSCIITEDDLARKIN